MMEAELYYYEGWEPWMLVSKGHISNDEFIQSVQEYAERQDEDYKDLPIDPEQIERGYMRCVPAPEDFDFKFTAHLSKPGRGAFKVTYFRLG